MQESLLKLYSLGIVVENKPPETDIILVSPIEVLNIQEPGLIREKEYKSEGKLEDITKVNFTAEIKSRNFLRAKWLPFGHSNRMTAPDVVANETVILFKYENVDEYYWTTIFREPELRRLEKVRYAYSNLPSGIQAFDKSTSYWMEIDTINKKVHFHTSDNDGEHTTYDFDIDTREGVWYLTDGRGNIITLKSPEDYLYIHTNRYITQHTVDVFNILCDNIINIIGLQQVNISVNDISLTDMDGDFIKIIRDGNDIHTHSIDDTLMVSDNTMHVEVQNLIDIKSNGTVNLTVANDTNVKSPIINVTADTINIVNSDTINVTSGNDINIHTDAKLNVSATSDINIDTSADSNVTVASNANITVGADANITASNVNIAGGSSITLSSPATGINSSTITLNGDVFINGNVETDGNIHATGKIKPDKE